MDALTQAQTDGVVIGLQGIAGVKPRLDIDEMLLTQPDTFNLFILALDELQKEQTTDKMSFYEVAGIHGLPRKYWDGVEVAAKEADQWFGEGYCAHSVIQFPTWHRPYLAMMEQTIFAKMADIVTRFPAGAQPKYTTALNNFRLPFWDYYRPRGKGASFPGVRLGAGRTRFAYDYSLPQIMTVEQVVVRRPSDDKLTLWDNPFYKFSYPTQDGFTDSDWTLVDQELIRARRTYDRVRTYRHPLNTTPTNDSFSDMNSVLNSQREPENRIILSMITDDIYSVYETFATASQSAAPNTPASGSLEDIHGQYHVLVGGTAGHMSTVPLAAFDPCFWLHHCQIDRWFAIWQARHPDSWFADDSEATSDLLPFRKSRDATSSQFWNSNDSRSTETFGYSYKDALSTADATLTNFRRKYEWAVRTSARPFGNPPADMTPLDLSKAQVYQFTSVQGAVNIAAAAVQSAPQVLMQTATTAATAVKQAVSSSTPTAAKTAPSKPSESATTKSAAAVAFTPVGSNSAQVKLAPSNIDESKYSRAWYVDNIVERLALNGSFSIYYFIGDFDKQHPERYMTQPTMAALNYVFTASAQACDNCGIQSQQGEKVTGTNDITPMLLDYVEMGELPDLSPANVKPFLIKNLKWRVVTNQGEQVNAREVRGFKIGVSSKLSPIPPATGSPLYEEFPEIIEQIIGNSS